MATISALAKYQNLLEIIANVAKPLYKKKVSEDTRINALLDALRAEGIEARYEGTRPSKGASFSRKAMKDGYRVNVRCGYGRQNYAPCVFIPYFVNA